jgi:hypothetical protein
VAQAVERLPHKHEALNLILNTILKSIIANNLLLGLRLSALFPPFVIIFTLSFPQNLLRRLLHLVIYQPSAK